MAAYGIKIFGDDGYENTGILNTAVIDHIYSPPSSSGSRSYSVESGETITLYYLTIDPYNGDINYGPGYSNIYMDGNTLRWSIATKGRRRIMQVLVCKNKRQ